MGHSRINMGIMISAKAVTTENSSIMTMMTAMMRGILRFPRRFERSHSTIGFKAYASMEPAMKGVRIGPSSRRMAMSNMPIPVHSAVCLCCGVNSAIRSYLRDQFVRILELLLFYA